jgi:hypothetical protein
VDPFPAINDNLHKTLCKTLQGGRIEQWFRHPYPEREDLKENQVEDFFVPTTPTVIYGGYEIEGFRPIHQNAHKDFDLTNSDVMDIALGPGGGLLDQFTVVVPLTVDGRTIFIGTPAYRVHVRYGKMLILSSAVTHGGVCYGERPREGAPKRYPAFHFYMDRATMPRVNDKVAIPRCVTEDDYESGYYPPEYLVGRDSISLAKLLCHQILNLRRTKKLLAINETFGVTMKKGGFLFTRTFMQIFLKKAGGNYPFTPNELSLMAD